MAMPIRRSQIISPFGIGSMVDFPGAVSLIHCGLDAWPFDKSNKDHEEFIIDDEKRLAERLGVDFFVLPPDYRYKKIWGNSDETNLYLRIPFLRFPKFHACPRCGLMKESELHYKEAPVCKGPIGTGKNKGESHSFRKTVQVRFVAACENGHIQDFPWWEWVLEDINPNIKGLRLRMVTSSSASLSGVTILCERISNGEIVKRKTLTSIFNRGERGESSLSRQGISCSGSNPALGEVNSTCGKNLQPLLRGGSNIYFPHIVSSIYLPTVDSLSKEEVLEILDDQRVWTYISMMADVEENNSISEKHANSILKKYYPTAITTPEELVEAANRKLKGDRDSQPEAIETDNEEQSFRREEYSLFCQDVKEGYPKTNLLIKSKPTSSYGSIISENFERISLIHKLRETRVFTGFSRIYPEDGLDIIQRRALISGSPREWLPAIIVRGEGIFFQVREEKIRRWIDQFGVNLTDRISKMQKMFDQLRELRHQEHREINPRFVLLHTLSHILINQLIFTCGYGSASLCERLYSSDDDNPMSGILIYTAAGDSEGTMGGLVRMGFPGRLEAVLEKALEKAYWCSSDPVCIESNGQGPDSCNLAACHSCCLLPETSCEEGNRLLDRGLIHGILSNQKFGFFSSK
jgi:uncharacterized protein DUF1998